MNAVQKTKELIAKKVLPQGTEVLRRLQGGTVSELYLLGIEGSPRYVIKANVPEVIESEASFLKFYEGTGILPELLYKDPDDQYLVYPYVKGETAHRLDNKRFILETVVKGFINRYKETDCLKGWGWVDEPVPTWEDFILNRVEEAKQTLAGHLKESDDELIGKLMKESSLNGSNTAYLLHGDCGVHNFLIENGELSGIIDPAPVIGPPLYDLLYAFCSSPEDLSAETILYCWGLLEFKSSLTDVELYREVLIILYIRLATCLRHHPQDFNEYRKAWAYWKAKVLYT
ncbi:aminoglycoside phosphotransferase family protein [Bacillus sp. SCS-153A]|uniref:aminoglycoside phosphotransferase family protein n=1 Tax=Rossellomorea sedimentorum TaxID=3115294 RepID=UPI003906815B